MERLRVIADDLTGACDVAAALQPWPEIVLVDIGGGTADAGAGLHVVNTASRTVTPSEAARRVQDALRGDPPPDIVLKKIDTGLRGVLGAEIDAAMDVLGAAEAFVLAAIPEAGRTTLGGVQLVDGVPVDRTAFARDPENPVGEARVARAIEATSRRGAGEVGLAALRGGTAGAAVDLVRASGASIVVFDAETDADLALAVGAIVVRPRPLLVVGSTGLARALRAVLAAGAETAGPRPSENRAVAGVLAIVGSVHPVAREQVARVALAGLARVEHAGDTDLGGRIGRALGRGEHVVLVSWRAEPDGALATLASAAREALGVARPRGLVVMGGETAQHVLRSLDAHALAVEDAPVPLVVRSRVVGGPFAGTRVVTKGGSSGPPERLVEMILEAAA